MIDYSPIIIPVYDRLDHLKSCLSALAVNPLAIHSELFIYMDHPKDELTMHIQDKIHDCIMTFLASFKNLQIISNDFTFCVELPIKAKRFKSKYQTIPSFERSRIGGVKKVNVFKDGLLILIKMVKLFFIK